MNPTLPPNGPQGSLTPRTDAEPKYTREFTDSDYVKSDFARQLERELNEAKAEAANSHKVVVETSQTVSEYFKEATTLRAQVARLTSERDEAKGEALGRKTQLLYLQSQLTAAESELAELRKDKERWKDCAEYGWTLIANAPSGVDWNKESKDWQAAAVRFREQYHAALSAQGEEEK